MLLYPVITRGYSCALLVVIFSPTFWGAWFACAVLKPLECSFSNNDIVLWSVTHHLIISLQSNCSIHFVTGADGWVFDTILILSVRDSCPLCICHIKTFSCLKSVGANYKRFCSSLCFLLLELLREQFNFLTDVSFLFCEPQAQTCCLHILAMCTWLHFLLWYVMYLLYSI